MSRSGRIINTRALFSFGVHRLALGLALIAGLSVNTGPATAEARDAGQSIANSPRGVIADVVAGDGHTCALLSTGQVTCWGSGGSGQLGSGTNPSRQNTPAAPITLPSDADGNPTTATAITAGDDHTCAILNTGQVTCWGRGGNGRLGNGGTGDRNSPTAPLTLPTDANGTPTTATAITAGGSHTCAILNTGQVSCWGQGGNGQLGNGTIPTSQDTPTAPITLPADANGSPTTAAAITAGGSHTCAILNTGQVTCWGFGGHGQLGNGTGTNSQTTPTAPIALPADAAGSPTTAAAITAGDAHTCAILNTGNITCWGNGGSGRLGNGDNGNQDSPTTPITLPNGDNGSPTTAATVTAGDIHTCATLNTGQVTCWGQGGNGRLGNDNGGNQNSPTAPITLPAGDDGNPTTATTVAAGGAHSCAILNTGQTTCWGFGGNGQLGNGGTTADQTTPVLTAPLPTIDPARQTAAIAAGEDHTCALLKAGQLTCWGSGLGGQLGNGSTDDQTTPTGPITLPDDAGGNQTTAAAVAAGNLHTCVILNTGQVSCWGFDGNEQLGNGTDGDQLTPAAPIILPTDANGHATTATAIDAGAAHTCVILNTGQVSCWGLGFGGQLGNGNNAEQAAPTAPITLPTDANGNATTATAITAGQFHTCAILNTGQVSCWGTGAAGRLGNANDSNQNIPIAPITLPTDANGNATTAAAISAGRYHTCALLNTGQVSCWGDGDGGQLGDGNNADHATPIGPISLPTDVNGNETTATAIATGSSHTCAILNTGQVSCWGFDGDGQLGIGNGGVELTPPPPITLPTDVNGDVTTATAITTGGVHTCALLSTGQVSCWGKGDSGRLGDGETNRQDTPVVVTFPPATPTLARATGQTSPTNDTTINLVASFDQRVALTAGDITLGGTAGATTATVQHTYAVGLPDIWLIEITGMTNDGTIEVTIPAGTLGAYGNTASNTLTVQQDTTGPVADIERPATQAGTVTATPLTFTVTFDEPVTGFTLDDITITGTTGATTANATLTGTGTTYTITITTVPEPGTIDIQITDGAVTDALGNPSTSANHDAVITINDETPPVLSLPDDITVDTEPGATTATVTYQATATDPDSTGNTTRRSATLGIDAFATTNIPVTCNPPSGTAFPVGSTTVTCTATDPAGNTATGTFTITVNAITAPTTTTPPTTTTTTTTPASPTSTTPPSPPTTAMPMPDPGIVLPATGNDAISLQLTLMLALLATALGATTVIVTRRR